MDKELKKQMNRQMDRYDKERVGQTDKNIDGQIVKQIKRWMDRFIKCYFDSQRQNIKRSLLLETQTLVIYYF